MANNTKQWNTFECKDVYVGNENHYIFWFLENMEDGWMYPCMYNWMHFIFTLAATL